LLLLLVNVAVNAREPADASVMLQLVAGNVALQVSLPPAAEIVTVPLGVPPPGLVTATANVTATACPTTDGSGVSALMLVVVDAAFTVCAAVLLVLPATLVSPA
jgi:hypothetical protein